jgi:TolA-binding protein
LSFDEIKAYSEKLKSNSLVRDFSATTFESKLRSDLQNLLDRSEMKSPSVTVVPKTEEINTPEKALTEYEKIKQKNRIEQLESKIKQLEKKIEELETSRRY